MVFCGLGYVIFVVKDWLLLVVWLFVFCFILCLSLIDDLLFGLVDYV